MGNKRLEWTLGERMEKALRSSGLSQGEIASIYRVSRATVSNWLHGRTIPNAATILIWAQLTNVPSDWLETGTLQEEQNNGE
jgi:transcriptional regulator with XRE-family HTH domain